MTGRVLRFRHRSVSSEESRADSVRLLEISFAQRLLRAADLRLEDPERLLSVCGYLRDQMDTSPARVREEAEFFYRFIERPRRAIGLFDERPYFLGELSLIAGTACRHLSRREEARLWFDRAEAGFRHTMSSEADLCRLAYQRLALRMEERQLETVLELAPSLAQSLTKLGMPEDALKCRFLEGSAFFESAHPEEAVEVYENVCRDAESLGSEKLLALGLTNLTHAYGALGDSEKAIQVSKKAILLLNRVDDRIGLGKIQWALGTVLREKGQILPAIRAYRAAQQAFDSLAMRADMAALSLVIADLQLEIGQDREATHEVLAALPVIEELEMVPEGLAALSLLRESVRQQRVNRQALRDLHGYFEDLKS